MIKPASGWPPDGWTIVTREDGHGKKHYFARYLATTTDYPLRKTYDKAMADVLQNKKYAEPWGV